MVKQMEVKQLYDEVIASIDALVQQVAREAREKLFATDIEQALITVTGSGPFESDDLVGWLKQLGADAYTSDEGDGKAIFNVEDWEENELVVVGRDDFNKSCLMTAAESQSDITFMSQEDFVNLLVFGVEPNYVLGDERILNHPGLSFLASIGFRWPSTYAIVGDGSGEEKQHDEKSWLRGDYGYSVAKNVSVSRRHSALNSAVEDMGLQETAELVAWLARTRKRTGRRNLSAAVQRYEDDLAWLKLTYYDGSAYSFRWPSTD